MISIIVTFVIWMVARLDILSNEALYPADRVMILQRDSNLFYFALRSTFFVVFIYGSYLMWKYNKKVLFLTTVLFYTIIISTEKVIMKTFCDHFNLVNDFSLNMYPISIYKGMGEAFGVIVLGIISYLAVSFKNSVKFNTM